MALISSMKYAKFFPVNYFKRLFYLNHHLKTEKALQHTECQVKLRESIVCDERHNFVVPIFKKSLLYADQIAIKDSVGEYTYFQLYMSAKKLSIQISNLCGSASSFNIIHLCSNNMLSPLSHWACWISGQVVVPLNPNCQFELLKYIAKDTKAKLIMCSAEYEKIAQDLADYMNIGFLALDHNFVPQLNDLPSSMQKLVVTTKKSAMITSTLNNDFYTTSNAMILYTAGTTGTPKGVILSHKNLDAQIKGLADAYQFTENDNCLHVLPLHQMQGCVNSLMCPLSLGGRIIMHDNFNSHNVWSTILGINISAKERVNVFMAVPSIYNLLLSAYDKIFSKNARMVEYIENVCKANFRLMTASCAPLPKTVFTRWNKITGHNIIESYGMTEIGTVLSNPYVEYDSKMKKREPSVVGLPLPHVKVRLVDSDNNVLLSLDKEEIHSYWGKETCETCKGATLADKINFLNSKTSDGIIGTLQIAGLNVFKGYLNQSEKTENAFSDEYFITDDIAIYENGIFKILGRSNVDIIKSYGYEISRLEIESLLYTHPSIDDCIVLGMPHKALGECVGVLCVLKPDTTLEFDELESFCSAALPLYKMPKVFKIVNQLPRNNMERIDKSKLIEMHFNNHIND